MSEILGEIVTQTINPTIWDIKVEGQARAPTRSQRGASSTRGPRAALSPRLYGWTCMDCVDDGGEIRSVHPAFPGNYRL